MTNKKVFFGILVMALVFGIIAAGNIEAQTDSQLNGTWVEFLDEVENELRLQNGNFEDFVNGVPFSKGTYTTNNGKIDWTLIQLFGEGMNQLVMTILDSDIGLESKWYSKNEFILAIRPALKRLDYPEEIIDEVVAIIISPSQDSYSVDDNTFITTSTHDGETMVSIYDRRY